MSEPVDPFFHNYSKDQNPNTPMGFGKRLYDKVTYFYSWFLSRDIKPDIHRELYKHLSVVLQISKISFEGGYFVKEPEENAAYSELDNLSDELNSGILKANDLSEAMQPIIKHLITNNPKSKLVFELMKLEYITLIDKTIEISPEEQVELKLLINETLGKIKPELSELHAQTASRQLEMLLSSSPDNTQKFLDQIKETLKDL